MLLTHDLPSHHSVQRVDVWIRRDVFGRSMMYSSVCMCLLLQLAQQLQAAVEKGKLQDATALLNKLKVLEYKFAREEGGRGDGGW